MANQNPTKLGLGLAALGRPGYINLGHGNDLSCGRDVAQMQERAHQVMDAAAELGIDYFDAARSYGRAEQFLASWLNMREFTPDQLTIASKWGYTYTAGWQVTVPEGESHEVKEHSLPRLETQLAESREILGKHLELYQIHSATLESGVLENDAVLDRLAELRDEGLKIGLSVSGPKQADTIFRALDCQRGEKQIFSAVQATWNLLEQSVAPALESAHSAGWRVIVKEGVANGRLTDRNSSPAFATKRKLLQDTADTHNSTIDAVALAAVLSQTWVSIALSGATTSAQLKSNVQARELVSQLKPADLQSLTAKLQEPAEEYWTKRSNLTWN